MEKACSKVVVENFFEPCVLFLLSDKPSYGYEIKSELAEKYGCKINIGNLYRCLARLQKQGKIEKKLGKSELGPDRKIYQITDAGKRLLKIWIDELELINKSINKLIINYQKNYETSK